MNRYKFTQVGDYSVRSCEDCGGVVQDESVHDKFHKLLDRIQLEVFL